MLLVENEAWKDPEHRATAEMLHSRIETYDRGVFVAEASDRIVGHASLQRVHQSFFDENSTWQYLTDGGFIRRSHNPHGRALYGVNLSVSVVAPRETVPFLMSTAKLFCVANGFEGIYVSPRIPTLRKYVRSKGEMNGNLKLVAEDYVRQTHKQLPRDPELRMYVQGGAKILHVLPDFFSDKNSLNFGVLAFWRNKLYRKKFIMVDYSNGYSLEELVT